MLDRYDSTLVLKIYTTVWLPRLTEVVEIIAEQVPHERLILRLSRNIQDKALPFTEGQILRGAAPIEPWSRGSVSNAMRSGDRRRGFISINVKTAASSNRYPTADGC